jgi:hypothetical protein
VETTVGTALEDDDREDSFTDEDSYAEAKDALRNAAWASVLDARGMGASPSPVSTEEIAIYSMRVWTTSNARETRGV